VNSSSTSSEVVRGPSDAPRAVAPTVSHCAPTVSRGPTTARLTPSRIPPSRIPASRPGVVLAARVLSRRPSQIPVVPARGDGVDAHGRTSLVLDVVGKGGGQPLAPEVRADMEGRLGSDFSDVRVHTDAKAAKSAAAISAKAYTVGNEVVFGQGSFAPESPEGQHRLAHELTHVQQQRKGSVSGTDTGSGVAVSDPSDSFEQEAEAAASRVFGLQSVASNGPSEPEAGARTGQQTLQQAAPVPSVVSRLAIDRQCDPSLKTCQQTGTRTEVPNAQRQAEPSSADTDSGPGSAPDSATALQQLIARVEQIQQAATPGEDADEYLPLVASTLEQMRAAAASDDEALKAAVVSAFTHDRLISAASQLPLASEGPYKETQDQSATNDASPPSQQSDIAAVQLLAVGRSFLTHRQDWKNVAVQRDAGAALMAAGEFLLATDAEASPAEAAAGPPGWAVAGTVAIIAIGLIGIGYLMASAQPETLSAEEEEAIRRKEAGEPYDKDVYNRARRKQIKNEKYEGERNKRKPRGGG
jgi:hypothetical protein